VGRGRDHEDRTIMRAFMTWLWGRAWWDDEVRKARGDRNLVKDLWELGARVTWALRRWNSC